MNRTDELTRMYRAAQDKIANEIDRQPEGTERQYEEKLLAAIALILARLRVSTERWSHRNMTAMYEERMREAYAAVEEQYAAAGKTASRMGGWTALDSAAAETARVNMNAHLTDAIEHTRLHMQTEVRRAAMEATEEAITRGQRPTVMQENLKRILRERGYESVPYIRNGQTCYMQLDAYAGLVVRTTEHEIRNTANINLGMRIGNDLVKMSEHWGACPLCTPCQGRVYSVTGASPYYPYLYDTPWSSVYQNFHPRCRHVLTQYIEDLKAPEEIEKMREYSNRSYDVGGSGWTKEQTEAANKGLANYREGQKRRRELYADRKQYERYRNTLGSDAPGTFAVFRKMKLGNTKRWQELQAEYRRYSRENAIIIEAKKPNGRHSGKYADASSWSDISVKRAMKNYTRQVEEHKNKILHPERYDVNWNKKDDRQKQGLINKWKKDLERNNELSVIMKSILKERGIKID